MDLRVEKWKAATLKEGRPRSNEIPNFNLSLMPFLPLKY